MYYSVHAIVSFRYREVSFMITHQGRFHKELGQSKLQTMDGTRKGNKVAKSVELLRTIPNVLVNGTM